MEIMTYKVKKISMVYAPNDINLKGLRICKLHTTNKKTGISANTQN